MQLLFLCKGLCDFNLCGLLLLFKVLQGVFCVSNAVGKIVDGVVQTDDIAACIIA